MTTNHPAKAKPATSNDITPGPFSEHSLREAWNQQADQFNQWDSLDSCEQLAWAQTQAIAADRARRPTPPAEGEAGGVVADLEVAAASYFNRGFATDARRCRRAADLLQQQAAELAMLRQMAVPVPVDERPWENKPGWLDPDGECWWCPPDGPAYWSMANPAMVYGGWLLPAHAIPVPPENRHHA